MDAFDFGSLLGRQETNVPAPKPSSVEVREMMRETLAKASTVEEADTELPPPPSKQPTIGPEFSGFADLPADEYHADPCVELSLSASIANIIDRQTLAHAWAAHPRLGNVRREETKTMAAGTLLHALLLGDEDQIRIVQADSWRTKAAKEARTQARAQGFTAVLEHEFDQAAKMAKELGAKMREKGIHLSSDGLTEQTIIWHETASDGTRVQCRGRMDHVDGATITDLKSSVSAHPDVIRRHIEAYGYAIQRAAYVSALEKVIPRLAGRVEFTFVFFELVAPYAVTPVKLDGTWREIGQRRWQRAVDLWAQARKTRSWGDYSDGVLTLDPPGWLLAQDERRMAEEEDAAEAAE